MTKNKRSLETEFQRVKNRGKKGWGLRIRRENEKIENHEAQLGNSTLICLITYVNFKVPAIIDLGKKIQVYMTELPHFFYNRTVVYSIIEC